MVHCSTCTLFWQGFGAGSTIAGSCDALPVESIDASLGVAGTMKAGTRAMKAGTRALEAETRALEAETRALEAGARAVEAVDVVSFATRSIVAMRSRLPGLGRCETASSIVNGGRTTGGLTNASKHNVDMTNSGFINGGAINGGVANGDRTDDGKTSGGLNHGGKLNQRAVDCR